MYKKYIFFFKKYEVFCYSITFLGGYDINFVGKWGWIIVESINSFSPRIHGDKSVIKALWIQLIKNDSLQNKLYKLI